MYASYIMTMYSPRSGDYVNWREFDLHVLSKYMTKHACVTRACVQHMEFTEVVVVKSLL